MAAAVSAPPPSSPALSRNVLIAGGVVLLHVGALWALQSGLLRRAVEVIVPVAVLSELVTPPRPQVEPPSPAPPPPSPKPEPVRRAAAPKPAMPPAPQPMARADTPAAPMAPLGVVDPQPAAPPVAAPVAAPAPATAPPAPAPAKVELPSSDADYLQNPKPAYPPISKRLGEQGKVVLRVLISADGRAEQAEVRQSSGFERLDQAARETVLKWRYVPGKRAGVPEAMWFNVPIHFVLE